MPPGQNEHTVSGRSQKMGEETSFEFFFRQYYTALCYFATSILHNEEEANDIVQDCYVKLLDSPTINERSETIKSFLYTSVHNRCVDVLRKKKVIQRAKLQIARAGEDELEYYDELAYAEMLRLVFDRIEELPEQTQQIIKLYYVAGKKHHEIADEVNSTAEAVRKEKARALKKIRGKFLFLFSWI